MEMRGTELIGQVALFLLFAMVAWALLREAGRVVVKALLILAVVVGLAVLLGFMDETAAGALFHRVGEWLIRAVTVVVEWLAQAWSAVQGAGAESGGA